MGYPVTDGATVAHSATTGRTATDHHDNSSDITAGSVIANNRLVRGDGGARGIQGSGITVDDTDGITQPYTGSADAIALSLGGTDTDSQALVVTEDNAIRTNALVQLTRHASATAPVIDITPGGASAALRVNGGKVELSIAGEEGEYIWSSGNNVLQLVAGTTVSCKGDLVPGFNTTYKFGGSAGLWTAGWFGHSVGVTLNDASDSMTLLSSTQANAGLPVYHSPSQLFYSYGWDTNGAGSPVIVRTGFQSQPVSGDPVTSHLALFSSIDGAARTVSAMFEGDGPLKLLETSAAAADSAGYGQTWWETNANPIFSATDDNGVDVLKADTSGIKTNLGNYCVEGDPTTRGIMRLAKVIVTGVTDATQVTLESESEWNSTALASETVDSDTPTGGTRFDVSADGETLTVKGWTPDVCAIVSAHLHSANATDWTWDVHVVSTNMTIAAHNSHTGAAIDFTSLANATVRDFYITYLTST